MTTRVVPADAELTPCVMPAKAGIQSVAESVERQGGLGRATVYQLSIGEWAGAVDPGRGHPVPATKPPLSKLRLFLTSLPVSLKQEVHWISCCDLISGGSAPLGGNRQMMAADFEAGRPPKIGTPRVLFEFTTRALGLAAMPLGIYEVTPDGPGFTALAWVFPRRCVRQ